MSEIQMLLKALQKYRNFILTGHPNLTNELLRNHQIDPKEDFTEEEERELDLVEEIMQKLEKTRLLQFHFHPDSKD